MSYDLLFLHREPGQSLAEAVEAVEVMDGDDEAEGQLPTELAEAWDRVVPQARELLGELDEHLAEDYRELSHGPSGVQLSFAEGEVALTVPYWHRGEAAARIVEDVYALAVVVQKETGMTGYDPQLDQSLDEARVTQSAAVAVLDETTRMLPDIWRDGER
ncbi:hypothetical protein [Amycolatopsis cihanbeyliensis]|uniref:Uncharacterized protein n=1 Tax=Amycolatopsis cihanbeyliensis TaxID=1128664 RepID=A0A542DLS0_AMYCI|nr:hypothetical protein [Amycolatopsis cihanbeyliensis]TQJ04039.1 hypothetical protein FB471_3819 [Amycolatopsis cihanbeyliensis]